MSTDRVSPNHPIGRRGAPYRILVSTTRCVKNVPSNMGNADYSYAFVLKALAPVLDRLGVWEIVDQPESSLSHRAALARAEGAVPVHLCLHPPHNAYLTPDVPTAIFPFWEFPDVPSRDLGLDTRQNWRRILGRADRILAACRFTASAFGRAGLGARTSTVPVPLSAEAFETTDWDPDWPLELECRHVVFGGRTEAAIEPDSRPTPLIPSDQPPWRRAAGGFYDRGRLIYKERVMRYLSEEAAEALFQAKNRMVRRTAVRILRPPLATLRLDGLVFTSIFNLGDRRKNIDDMLSAFLLAFRDRLDATLVLKLATNPDREYFELKELKTRYDRMNIRHACRVVAITDYLPDDQLAALRRATTYYVNTSRAEGACLPLQEALAAGRPAIAPRHTAMEDYIDEEVAFVVRSDPEPTIIPHDPEPRFETQWHRLSWQQLHDRFLDAARIADRDRERYQRMAESARRRMSTLYSRDASAAALTDALHHLGDDAHRRRLSWPA